MSDLYVYYQPRTSPIPQLPRDRRCINCLQIIGTSGGHFVLPSMGEEGFFICEEA